MSAPRATDPQPTAAGGRAGLLAVACVLAVWAGCAGCGSGPAAEARPEATGERPAVAQTSLQAPKASPEAAQTPSAQDDEKAIADVLLDSARAFRDGDGEAACAAYTDSGRDQLVEFANADQTGIGAKGRTCEQVSQDFAELIRTQRNGAFQNGGDPTVEDVEVDGDTATATFVDTSGQLDFTETITLVRQDGRWLIDKRAFNGYAQDG